MKYRKKPVVVEAFQMTKEIRWCPSQWPEWLALAWIGKVGDVGAMWSSLNNEELLEIGTLEGVAIVSWDDWIIKGVKGECYPCKPDIFEATYEPVEDEAEYSTCLYQ